MSFKWIYIYIYRGIHIGFIHQYRFIHGNDDFKWEFIHMVKYRMYYDMVKDWISYHMRTSMNLSVSYGVLFFLNLKLIISVAQ